MGLLGPVDVYVVDARGLGGGYGIMGFLGPVGGVNPSQWTMSEAMPTIS